MPQAYLSTNPVSGTDNTNLGPFSYGLAQAAVLKEGTCWDSVTDQNIVS